MRGVLEKYAIVYGHLWQTFGSTWQVRLSYVLQFVILMCKLIFLPVAISWIIAHLAQQDYLEARNAVFLYLGGSALTALLSPLVKYIGMRGENRVYRELTTHYFTKLVSTDITFFNSNLTGYLTTATRHYVDGCIQLVRSFRDQYLPTMLRIVFPIGVIVYVDLPLGLVALGVSLTSIASILWASRVIDPHRTAARELYKRNSGRMADIVANILAIKATAQEKSYIEQVREGSYQESLSFTRRYTVQAKMLAVREGMTVIIFAALFLLAVYRMSTGQIELNIAVLVITYTATILVGIYALADDVDNHDDTIDRIIPAFEILQRHNHVQDPVDPIPFSDHAGVITFHNVSFSYEQGAMHRLVLQDFSIQIPHGQKVGVVGMSGAGKSTITKLLLRFSDVEAGEVRINGVDVRRMLQTDLRKHIAYVPQEPLLLHASIRDNVILSNPTATDSEIRRALKVSHAREFIQHMPDGLESIVGERGVKLSGGQKQRIAIARAVLQQAPIMILDEATSALDSESEQIIKQSFSEVLRGKTAIVVAHRLSTLSDMDRIIVIDNGRLVEDGTHEELLANGGLYAKLWQRQHASLAEV